MKKIDKKIDPNELREQLKKGKTYKELTEYFNCSRSCIFKCKTKNNIKIRVKSPKIKLKKELLRQLYIKERFTVEQLALYFQCCKLTITKALKDFGIKKKVHANLEKNIKEMERLYLEEGWTSKKIAEYFNCAHKTVRQLFWIHGIRKGTHDEIIIDKELLIKLYNNNVTINEIANALGCKPHSVSHKIKKFGLKKRRKQ